MNGRPRVRFFLRVLFFIFLRARFATSTLEAPLESGGKLMFLSGHQQSGCI